MYANAKPVINPEHQYDRQATFLRIKDLLEERARAMENSTRPEDRRIHGWTNQTFDEKYIYPHMYNRSPPYSDNLEFNSTPHSGYSTNSNAHFSSKSQSTKKKFVKPTKKYVSPAGPDRKVFRGQKSMPYNAYTSSYGTYPNHAILSIGNADQGIPRWEIRAVPRDGPIHDPRMKRKVIIDEKTQVNPGFPFRIKPNANYPVTQRILKSILKKGPTYPERLEMLKVKAMHEPELNIRKQTSSEEILMVAKENAAKRQAVKNAKARKERIPVVEKAMLNNEGGPVVTWLRPAFVQYATSEMVAMPDVVMERLKKTSITPRETEDSSATRSTLSSSLVATD